MPESFNAISPTPSASPKPAREGGAQGATNESPAKGGAAAGGLDSPRANPQTLQAADSRAKTSSLKKTGAAVATFADATT